LTLTFDTDPAGCSGGLSRLLAVGYFEESVRSRLGLKDLNDLQMRAAPIYRQERILEREGSGIPNGIVLPTHATETRVG
jgi:hypothetical protein